MKLADAVDQVIKDWNNLHDAQGFVQPKQLLPGIEDVDFVLSVGHLIQEAERIKLPGYQREGHIAFTALLAGIKLGKEMA